MKNNNNEIQKTLSIEETKDFILSNCSMGNSTKRLLNKLGTEIIPKVKHGSEKEKQNALEEITSKSELILRAYENITNVALMESFDGKYQEFAREFCDQLKTDYRCNTVIEQSLAGLITNSYIRILDNSRRLNNEFNCTNISSNRNKYISNLSIQLDRANRQFLQAITTLKQLKAPSIGINIKTNNTFVAQNQQINDNKKNNETK